MKFLTLIKILVTACLLAGIYGILHDQLTYTISHEYYTKFKFYQFGFATVGDEAIFDYPRIYVGKVGFLATWWTGIPIGLILGLVGLVHKDHKQMYLVTFKALIITLLITLITGLVGLTIGFTILANSGVDWWLPHNLIHKTNFIAVGSMHNFSYLGGGIGMIVGIVYSAIVAARNKSSK
ncbi:MAG: hypothetical protein R2780_09930 [Crocinitomicaceae bacterium]